LPPADEISPVEGERFILRSADPKNNIKRLCARSPHLSAWVGPCARQQDALQEGFLAPASIPFWLANGLADALCWLQWNAANFRDE